MSTRQPDGPALNDPDPNDPVPDTAMASGTDAGEPGGHLGPADLSPDEERLLAELQGSRSGAAESPDDVLQELRAAEDEAPLPDRGGLQDDGLTPTFTAPPDED